MFPFHGVSRYGRAWSDMTHRVYLAQSIFSFHTIKQIFTKILITGHPNTTIKANYFHSTNPSIPYLPPQKSKQSLNPRGWRNAVMLGARTFSPTESEIGRSIDLIYTHSEQSERDAIPFAYIADGQQ